jgi:succinyl-CoA synthetase beta subunit
MKIHEYQAKSLLREFRIKTPEGRVCFSVEEAVAAAETLDGSAWVVKAQIHAGGRGKGGGVKLAHSIPEVKQFAEGMLGMTLVTPQTGPRGRVVRRLLVEESLDIRNEFYAGLVVDRTSRQVCLIASSEGGMDIEKVAIETPEKIRKILIDPFKGLTVQEAGKVAREMAIPDAAVNEVQTLLDGVYRLYDSKDASLVEINPLVFTAEGQIVALDAKINFDDNALFRHPDIASLRDPDEEDPAEIEASAHGLSYISLDGNIGCLVNGAGLAMATMDIIKLYGGDPANFLDVGGGATAEKVTEAFKLMLRNPELRAILINIFGGIMKCDVIANGVVAAAREVHLDIPLVVRLEGTNVDLGKKILDESGLAIILAPNMAEAAEKVVAAARSPAPQANP